MAVDSRTLVPGAAALGAGALVAVALPPWGLWPAAFIGLALLDRLLAGRPARSRAARTWLFGVGWYAPGMGWMWFLTAPGYLVAVAAFAGLLALAGAAVPPGRGRRLALPGALTLAEAIRFVVPFGGVPLASLAIGQASGPLAPIARLAGPLGLTLATVAVGVGLSALAERAWRPAVVVLGLPVLLAAAGAVAFDGTPAGTTRVAYVQGGGPQGTRAIHSNAREVVERHLAATRQLEPGDADVVVWPENVIDVVDFESSRERVEVVAEAARLGVPILVGLTEDTPDREAFTNAQIVVLPDGTIADRYDKQRRVPFGEYMPFRDLLTAIGAPTHLVPRDAVSGTGPAYVDTPIGRVGVVISWEVFFAPLARDGVTRGGRLIVNPTNGSSYTGTVLQTQQVASSRLRALETGRWVVQVSPTGFSAFVSPQGEVFDRSSVSEVAVAVREVGLRTGRTLAVRLGEWPVVLLAAGLLAAGAALGRRRQPVRESQGAVSAP